jgi:Domain of unknown function (DUF4270)
VRCTLQRQDSIRTSDPNGIATLFLCGQMNDPVFGKSKADIYTLATRSTSTIPVFRNARLDSVVLTLAYVASATYGDTLQPQQLRVFRVNPTDSLRQARQYYSGNTLPADQEIGRLINYFPRPRTATRYYDTTATTARGAYVQLRLDEAFGNELLAIDSATLANTPAFWRIFRGLKIVSESQAAPGAMLAFNLNNRTFTRLRLHYKLPGDTIQRKYDFLLDLGNKFVHFEHDYANTNIESLIGRPLSDAMYLQGMGGLRLKVELPYIDRLEDVVVNKAQFVLTIATPDNPQDKLFAAPQLLTQEPSGDSILLSRDVVNALRNGGLSNFGGNISNESDPSGQVRRYRFTLSDALQDMIDDRSGDIKKRTFFVNIADRSLAPYRSVVFGPRDARFPAKIELKYTRLK